MIHLGGPGVGCSAMRVRRLAAGELAGDEHARTQEHLAACARCQDVVREIGDERARVATELPFEALAAGVAERLAAPAGGRVGRAGRLGRAVSRWAPAAALAAGVMLAVAYPTALRLRGEGATFRTKGAAEVTLWIRDGAEARALAPDEPVPGRAALRVGLSPAGRRFAAVALVDADGAVILHAGAAQAGVLPGAFEWTGAGTGTLVVVLDDSPIDPAALVDRLARGGPAAAPPGRGAEVIVRTLRRGEGP
jgi:hypothetical protein